MTQTAAASSNSTATGKRPGGLTALAVLNFVFGGLGVFGVIGLFAVVAMVSSAASALGATQTSGPSVGAIYATIGLSAVNVLLLIVSGIGYLGQKKFLGRTLGSLYGVLSIVASVVSIVLVHSGFGVGTIIGLAYPLLTLFLLNVTYKDNLVR